MSKAELIIIIKIITKIKNSSSKVSASWKKYILLIFLTWLPPPAVLEKLLMIIEVGAYSKCFMWEKKKGRQC